MKRIVVVLVLLVFTHPATGYAQETKCPDKRTASLLAEVAPTEVLGLLRSAGCLLPDPTPPGEVFRKFLTKIKKSRKASVEGVQIALKKPKTSGRWIADRYGQSYGSSWFIWTAQRGTRYLTVDFTVSSEDLNPYLAPIALYSYDGSRLVLEGVLDIKLYRWESYGSYLGNYGDTRNDFAYSRSIRFTAALQVADDTLKKPLLVVVGGRQCFSRRYDRWKNPPVEYQRVEFNGISCSLPPYISKISAFHAADLHPVHTFNWKKVSPKRKKK